MPALRSIKFTVPAELAKYVRTDVPREARMMAARGTLPLQPKDNAVVLFFLAHDKDEEIKTGARDALLKMPDAILKGFLGDQQTHPLILDFYGRNLKPESELLQDIALNPRTHDETIAALASVPNRALIDIISNNQIRILRHPPIVTALGENPLTGQAVINRILQFVALETGAKLTDVDAHLVEEDKKEAGEMAVEIPDAFADSAVEDGEGATSWALAELPDEFLTESDDERTEEELENLTTQISKASIPEKIKLATLGNKEARSILVRDTNKIVATAAIRSPKITENEIEAISRNRAVCDDVIRIIANNHEWTRNYSVKLNLVSNVKTPLQTSLRMLNFIQDRDLNQLGRSKNVPGPVSQAARKLLAKRRERK